MLSSEAAEEQLEAEEGRDEGKELPPSLESASEYPLLAELARESYPEELELFSENLRTKGED